MSKKRRIPFRAQHWAWLNAIAALGVWGALIGLFTPLSYGVLFQQPLIGIWSAVTVLGAIIVIVAVFWSVAQSAVLRTLAVSVELIGLCFASAGPLVYFFAQIVQFFEPTSDGGSRYALTFFAYFALSMIIYRVVVLFPRFRQEAIDGTKDV